MEKHRYVLQVLRVEFEENLTTPNDLIYTNIMYQRDGVSQRINSDYGSFQGKSSFAWNNSNESILHINPCSCDNSSEDQLHAAYPSKSAITLQDVLNNSTLDDPQLTKLLSDSHFITVEIKRTAGSILPNATTQATMTNHDDQSLGKFFLSSHDRHGLQILHIYNTALHHVGRVVILWFPMLPQMLISLPTYQQPEKKFFFSEGDLHKQYAARRTLLSAFMKLLFKPTFPEDTDVYQDYWEELHTLAKNLQEPDFRAMFVEQLTPLEYQSLKGLATGSSLLASILQQQEMPAKGKGDGKDKKDDKSDLFGLDENPPYLTHPAITSVFLTFLNMCLNLCNQTRDFSSVYHILQISTNFSYSATVLSALKGNQVVGKSHSDFLCSAFSITKSHIVSRSPNLWNFIYLEAIKLCDAMYTTNQSNPKNVQLFKHLFWSRRLAHVSQSHHRASMANLLHPRRDDVKGMSDSCTYQKLFFHLSSKYQSPSTTTLTPPTPPTPSGPVPTNAVANSAQNELSISFAGDDLDDEKPSFVQSVQYRLAHHFSTIHGTAPEQSQAVTSSTEPSSPISKIETEDQFRSQYERLLRLTPKDKDRFLIIKLVICTLFSLGQDAQQITAFIIGLNLDQALQRIVVSWWDSQQVIVEALLPDRALYKELPQTSDERWLHARSTFGLPEGTEPSASLYPSYPSDPTGEAFQNGDFWVQKQSTPTTGLVNPSGAPSQPKPTPVPSSSLHSSYSISTVPGQSILPPPAGPKLDWGKEPKRPLPIHVSLVPPPDWTHYNEYISAQHQARALPSARGGPTLSSASYRGGSSLAPTIVEEPASFSPEDKKATPAVPTTLVLPTVSLITAIDPDEPGSNSLADAETAPTAPPNGLSGGSRDQLARDDLGAGKGNGKDNENGNGHEGDPVITGHFADDDNELFSDEDYTHSQSASYYSDYTDTDLEPPDMSVGEVPQFDPPTASDDEDWSDYSDEDATDTDIPQFGLSKTRGQPTIEKGLNESNSVLSGKSSSRQRPVPSNNDSDKSLTQAIDELPMVSDDSEHSDSGSEPDDDFFKVEPYLMTPSRPTMAPQSSNTGPTPPLTPNRPVPSTPSRPSSRSVAVLSPGGMGFGTPTTPRVPVLPARSQSVARLVQTNSANNTGLLPHSPSTTGIAIPITQPTPAIHALTRRHHGQSKKTSSIIYNPVFTSVARRRHVEALNFFNDDLVPLHTSLGFSEVGELIQDNSYSSLPAPMRRRNALQLSTNTRPTAQSRNYPTLTSTDAPLMTSDQNSTGWTRIPFEFMHGETSLLNLDVYCLDMPSILHYATRPRRQIGPITNPHASNASSSSLSKTSFGGSIGGSIGGTSPASTASSQTNPNHPISPLSSISPPATPLRSTHTPTTTASRDLKGNNLLTPEFGNSPAFSLTSHQLSPPLVPLGTDRPISPASPELKSVRWFPELPVHNLDNLHISFSVSSKRPLPLPSSFSPNTTSPPHALSYPRDIQIPTSLSATQEHPHIEPDLEITVSSLRRILDDAVSRGRLTLTNYRLVYSPYVYVSPHSSHEENGTNPHQHMFTDWIEPTNQPTHCNEPNCSRCIESRCRRVFGTIPLQSIHRLEIVEAHEAKAKSFQLSILDEFRKIDQSRHIQSLPESQQLALQRNVSIIGPSVTTARARNQQSAPGGVPTFSSQDPQDGIAVTLPPLASRPALAPPGQNATQQHPPALTTLARVPSGRDQGQNYTGLQTGTQGGTNNVPPQTGVIDLNQLNDTPLTSDILFRLITQWCMGPQRPQFHDSISEETSVIGYEHSTTISQSTTYNHGHSVTHAPTTSTPTNNNYANESLMHIRCKDIRQVTFCIKHAQQGRSPQQLWGHFRHLLRQVAYAKPWTTIADAGPRCAPHVIELAKRIETVSPTSLKHLSRFFHLYAFVLSSNKGKESNGWDIYDPKAEYERQGCLDTGDFIEFDNSQYQLCQTYPQHLLFQWRTRIQGSKVANSTMTAKERADFVDNVLVKSAKYRSKGRLPSVTFYHSTTGGTILRSAQPLPGITNSRSSQDQDLCNRASISAIFDARPKANAQANKMKGGGFEPKPELYNSQLIFCDIENIHKMRAALKTITTICREACPHVLVSNSYDAGVIHTAMLFQHASRIIATSEAYQRQQLMAAAAKVSAPSSSSITSVAIPTQGALTPPVGAAPTPTSTISASSKRRGSFATSVTTSQSNLHNYTGVQTQSQLFIPSATDIIARCGVKTLPERYSQLINSEWAGHITGLLRVATNIAQHVLDGKSCLVRCSDGWDRTAQMACLSQLMLDPYFRTIQGFAVLIEKDFLSFGHKFSDRCGHADPDHANVERSPIFLQFLDAVFQLVVQNPTAFEFDDTLLHYLATHAYSCKYGTFLFNNHRERHHLIQAQFRTVSIWDVVVCKHKKKFLNPHYDPTLAPALKKVFPALPAPGAALSADRERCCDRSFTECAESSALLWLEAPWSPWNFYFRWDMRTSYEYKL